MPIRLKLTVHAQSRFLERGIEIEHVRAAILHPDSSENAYEGKIKVRKKINAEKEIEVIYFKDGFRGNLNDRIVVTAYYI